MTVKDPSKVDSSVLFQTIGEHNRLKVLKCLMEESQTVSEIQKKTKIEKTLLSKHLKSLRSAGLIFATRAGRHIHYEMNPSVLRPGKPHSLYLHCCEIKLHEN